MNTARVLRTGGVMLLLIVAVKQGHAQTGGTYDLTWSSMDAGGKVVAGGEFKLASVFGQPEPEPILSGGSFSLTGGFLQDGSYFPVPVAVSSFILE